MRASEALPERFNAAAHFVDRNVAEGRGASTAFLGESRTLTYADLQSLTNRTGNALRALSDSRAKAAVVSAPLLPEAAPALAESAHLRCILVAGPPGSFRSWEEH